MEVVIDDDDLVVVTAAKREEQIEVHAYVSPVPRLTLAERIARALDPAVLRNREDWQKASMDIVTAIPADAFAALAAAPKAIIVPDGVFWRVPFEALPVKGGSLADQTSVTYAGSLTSLIRLSSPAKATEASGTLAVAAPQLTSDLRDRLSATAPGWTLRAPESADLEAQRVVAELGEPAPVVRTGASATEVAFRADALNSAVLHLAAPFRMNSASPLFSPLLFAGDASTSPDRDSASDGVLEAREVMNLELHAGVTVLSDGAALSMRDGAAATPTVQWAWRVAGVPSIVLRRWTGDDAAGAEIIAAFHREIKGGATPEAALQAARAAVRTREGMSAPYFWADWMVVGREQAR
jgi:CHAT domain-containing protein